MALQGKLIADFESFYGAVTKAEANLKSFEQGAGKVSSSLNRVSDSLSGTKIIQQAAIAAEAVERIGGVSKLTESELSRLSAQAKEAAEKMTRMGVDVPPGIQRIADATKGATAQATNWKGAITAAAGAFGAAFSVGAVVQFGKSVFDSASKIHDLASQLGISTDAVQGFKFAAEDSGSSLDAVGTALTKMNANLAEGDKSTVKALKDAGLGFAAIRSMKPEDAFLAITDAVQQIEDPMVQTDVALKLFGKSAAELLPAIKEGFRGAADGAMKMSENTVKSLEASQAAWERFGTKVTIVSGTIIASIMDVSTQAGKSSKDFALFVDNAIKLGIGGAAAMAQMQAEIARGGTKAKDVYLGTGGAVRQTKEEIDAAAAASKRWGDALDASFRKWSGKDVAEQAKILDITFRRMADSGQITEKQLRAMSAEAAKLAEQGAILSPRLWAIVQATGELDPKLTSDAEAFARVGSSVDLVLPKLSAFNQAMVDLNAKTTSGFGGLDFLGLKVSPGLDGVIQKTIKETDELGELSRAFADLSQVAGGSLGGIARDFGTLVASANTAAKSINSIKSGFSAGGFSGILDMTSGVLGLASAAISAGKAIASLFDRNKGRDLVKDFAASQGGFDALQRKLSEMGAEGERLWIALTQGVGRNNPEQAKAAIEAVTAALDAQKSKAAEAAQAAMESAAQQARAQQDALDAITTKYADTISKLDSEYKSLNDSVSKEATEAVMGVVETQERARMEQIAAEKAAQEAMRDAEIAAKKLTFESWVKDGKDTYDQLEEIFGKTLDIPYRFVQQGAGPDGGGATYVPSARAGAGAGGGASASLTVPVYLNEREVGRGMLEVTPGLLTAAGR